MSTVKVNMQVGGIADVRKAFRSVKDVVRDAEQVASKEAARAATQRQKIQADLAKERIRAEGSVSKEFVRMATAETRAAERAAQARVRATESANKAIQRSADQTAKYLERVQLNSAKSAGRIALQQAKEEERAATAKQRAFKSNVRTYGGAAVTGISKVANFGMKAAGVIGAVGGGFTLADTVQRSFASDRAAANLANSLFDPDTKKRFSATKLKGLASHVRRRVGHRQGRVDGRRSVLCLEKQ